VANHACDFEKKSTSGWFRKKDAVRIIRQTHHNMHAVHTFAARLYEARFWLFLAINLIGFRFLSQLSPN
jgi:hypothetical protein